MELLSRTSTPAPIPKMSAAPPPHSAAVPPMANDVNVLLQHHNPPMPLSRSVGVPMQMPLPPPPMPVNMNINPAPPGSVTQSPTIASPSRAFHSTPPRDMALSRSALGRPGLGTPPNVMRASRTNSGGASMTITRKRTNSPRTVARRGPLGTATPGSGGASGTTGGSTAADAVLPRGSVVRITGNNRTKRELLNREGLVLSAQTLGGWHEVALHDGANVRVQRNALTLLNAPSPATVAMLPPISLEKAATNDTRTNSVVADMSRLDDSSLRNYKRFHRLAVSEDASRTELVGAVKRHFARTKVNENEVIRGFVRHMQQVKTRSENHQPYHLHAQHGQQQQLDMAMSTDDTHPPTMSNLTNIPNTATPTS